MPSRILSVHVIVRRHSKCYGRTFANVFGHSSRRYGCLTFEDPHGVVGTRLCFKLLEFPRHIDWITL
jgi:hypothetical protein